MVRLWWNRAAPKNLAAGGNNIGKRGIGPASAEASAIRVEATARRPRQHLRGAGGVFSFERQKWQQRSIAANGAEVEEERLPISALLARIRKLVPKSNAQHYDEIVRNFGVGALRPPPTPMSDGELAHAIAEFLKDSPSAESVAALGRRLDPTSPL